MSLDFLNSCSCGSVPLQKANGGVGTIPSFQVSTAICGTFTLLISNEGFASINLDACKQIVHDLPWGLGTNADILLRSLFSCIMCSSRASLVLYDPFFMILFPARNHRSHCDMRVKSTQDQSKHTHLPTNKRSNICFIIIEASVFQGDKRCLLLESKPLQPVKNDEAPESDGKPKVIAALHTCSVGPDVDSDRQQPQQEWMSKNPLHVDQQQGRANETKLMG
eukprot:5894338-Amphidinium_carterae.1